MSTNDPYGTAVPNHSISGWQSTEDTSGPNASHLPNTSSKDSTMTIDDLTQATEAEINAFRNDPNTSSDDKFFAAMVLQNREIEKTKQEAAQANDPVIASLYAKATDPKAPRQERALASIEYSEARGMGEDFPMDVKLASLQTADADVYKAVEALLLSGNIEELRDKGISQEAMEDLLQQPEFLRDVKSSLVRRVTDELLDGGWSDPISLHSNSDLPSFPVEGMPPVLRQMVEGVAEELQVPVDLVSVMVLATLAASLVGRVNVKVRGSWDETVTLYALGLADSGNRKSAIMGQLNRPLLDAQKAIREQTEGERLKKMKEKAAADLRVKSTTRKASKDSATLEDCAEAAEAQAEAESIVVPAVPDDDRRHSGGHGDQDAAERRADRGVRR
jgi:hypothetical protein